jgi:Meiotically Up-regulated Gene 113 (MUG113) protein
MSVYFIQMGNHGPIKIGHTRNIDRRLAMLQSANPEPLTVRLILEGGRPEEKSLHAKFRADRIGGEAGGEWFRPSEAILNFIKSYPTTARDHVLGWLEHRYNKPESKRAVERRNRLELKNMQKRVRAAERDGRVIYAPAAWDRSR